MRKNKHFQAMFLSAKYSETQQYKRYRCQKMLSFTRVVVILCFSVFLKVYFLDGV